MPAMQTIHTGAPATGLGTAQHQALLACITDFYRHDPRIRAVIVFGSLGRGNWDEFSDLDMDFITADGLSIDIRAELERLGAALSGAGHRAVLLVPDGGDEAEIGLESLMTISVRWHPLASTSPHIVSSMVVLAGSLTRAEIAAAGEANRPAGQIPLADVLAELVIHAAWANVYYQRGQAWVLAEVLHRMNRLMLEIFTRTHGEGRVPQAFESLADPALQARLGAAMPRFEPAARREAVLAALDLIENGMDALSGGQLALTGDQRAFIRRARQKVEAGEGNP